MKVWKRIVSIFLCMSLICTLFTGADLTEVFAGDYGTLQNVEYIKDVASKVGYQNAPQHFSRDFTKQTGLSPKEYRLKNGL